MTDPVRLTAIGDSFTEGVGDPRPDGTLRGWADRVADGLAASGQLVEYTNFAIRGRLLDDIASRQLTAALALRPAPTILLVNGGGNDMLRPRVDIAQLVARTSDIVTACQSVGIQPVLLSCADPSSRLPFGHVIHRRAAALTDGLADIATGSGAGFVDLFNDEELRGARYWCDDRIHLNARGHERVARLVLAELVTTALDASTDDATPSAGTAASHFEFVRAHLVPWVARRLTGRSSGDGRAPKYPLWQQVPPRHAVS